MLVKNGCKDNEVFITSDIRKMADWSGYPIENLGALIRENYNQRLFGTVFSSPEEVDNLVGKRRYLDIDKCAIRIAGPNGGISVDPSESIISLRVELLKTGNPTEPDYRINLDSLRQYEIVPHLRVGPTYDSVLEYAEGKYVGRNAAEMLAKGLPLQLVGFDLYPNNPFLESRTLPGAVATVTAQHPRVKSYTVIPAGYDKGDAGRHIWRGIVVLRVLDKDNPDTELAVPINYCLSGILSPDGNVWCDTVDLVNTIKDTKTTVYFTFGNDGHKNGSEYIEHIFQKVDSTLLASLGI